MAPRFLVACACMLLPAAASSPDRTVAYVLSPVLENGSLAALNVAVSFNGNPSGTTILRWPIEWAGDKEVGRWARDIRVDGATSVSEGPNGTRTIKSRPGAALTVRYRIVSAFDRDPDVINSRQSLPVIRPTWFYAVGEAVFAGIEDRDDATATFAWTGAPPGFGFASDLEHLAGPGRAPLRPGTVGDVQESIVIGGRDLRVSGDARSGSGVRIATIGRFDFAQPAFAKLAEDVIASQRAFWGVRGRLPFLVAMTPLKPKLGSISFSGTGRSDAFALWVGENSPLELLGYLLAHEYFHSWNPRQLGGLPDGDAQIAQYWFSEGFTDFYTRRLLVRAGLNSPQQFANAWNEALAAYAISPFQTATNASAAKLFWTEPVAEKLPYQRGAMLAAIWDARLRRQSAGKLSLDDVLRKQRRDPRTRLRGHGAPEGKWSAATLFPQTAASFGLNVAADIAKHVDAGAALLLPADAFGPCAKVDTSTRRAFERGWDPDATAAADSVVTGLDPASPAYAAGLRNGMKIIARDAGTPGDSRVAYVLRVDDKGTKRTLTFKPEGKTMSTVQEVVLNAGLIKARPDYCARTLSGLTS